MKLLLGLVLAFAVGFTCRAFGIPSPAPPVIVGAMLVVAITVGYLAVDRFMRRRVEAVTATQPATTAPVGPAKDDREGPLPGLLVVLTLVTGLVDAVSYLKLGHVFVANMTGNVAFLGFAVAGVQDFSIAASLAAIAAFLAGALAGGWIGSRAGHHRGRFLAIALVMQVFLVGIALLVAWRATDPEGDLARYALIVLLSLSMGLQNATARRLGVADLTTTVLTLTLTGLASDSSLAGGRNPHPGRRLIATGTMFLGAAIGAFLVMRVGVVAALSATFGMLAINAIGACRASKSTAPWTVGT